VTFDPKSAQEALESFMWGICIGFVAIEALVLLWGFVH
jgi:hypothetical protein